MLVFYLFSFCGIAQESMSIKLTTDGAWCWFSDPRAIYIHGDNPGILTGWVTSDGSIEAGLLSQEGKVETQVVSPQLDKDDHANPAFLELEDSLQMIFYVKHSDEYIRCHTVNPEANSIFDTALFFDPFDDKELEKFPKRRITYVNPMFLEEEMKIFCFGRWTGYKPNMMTSSDRGKTFSKAQVFITNYPFNDNNRPYVKYFSDRKSKIHITFTNGHPRDESLNSVYYAYYEKGKFHNANGSIICSTEEIPFEPEDVSIVYQADSSTGKSWIFDIAADSLNNPAILYACYPDDSNHIYYYAKFNGEKWMLSKICNSGNWFPQTPIGNVEPEPNYSGGMCIHPMNNSTIYVSEKVDGVFEIIKYQLDSNGVIIDRTAITRNSESDNVRPYVPRNMKEGDPTVVLWMQIERYIHYTDFKTSIQGYFDN